MKCRKAIIPKQILLYFDSSSRSNKAINKTIKSNVTNYKNSLLNNGVMLLLNYIILNIKQE